LPRNGARGEIVIRQATISCERSSGRLFDGVPKSYRLDLVSSTASSHGIVELRYRRHR
jgi:hypothetical protein